MPLINCPECAKDVSSSAVACPNCGHPIATNLPQAPEHQSASAKPGETLGLFLIIIPLAAAAFSWFWVMQLRLIDNPTAKLGLITLSTILLTAILSTIESAQLGIGGSTDILAWKENKNRSGKMKPPSPITWFFGVATLWLFVYPTYLFYRSRYGAKNLIGAGLLAMVMFLGTTGYVYVLIENAQQNVNQQMNRNQQELQRLFGR